MTLQYITLHYIALHSITMQNIIALHYIALLYSTSHCTILHDITLHGITSHCMTFRKLLFPISLQLKDTRLPRVASDWPSYTVGVIYVYICIDCQSSILSHMVPELINNLICWNCKGCIGKSIGPVQYRFTIPSLLAQCHVAGSMPRCWLSAS